MKKLFFKGVPVVFLLFLFFSGLMQIASAQEKLTITTYYPSPYGVYKTLRLFPDAIALDGACTAEGEMEYSSVEHRLLVCTNITPAGAPTLKWQTALGAGGAALPPGTLCGACILGTNISCQGVDVCATGCPAGWTRLGNSIGAFGVLQFCVKN
jgi:hypothetical protein